MSMKKITELFLALSLLLCFAGGIATVVRADDPVKPEKTEKKRKGCHDLDRNASADEEKSSGDCNGTVPTPEPVSIILFTAGLAGVGFAARRRLRKAE
jgi:hypothetical protein